jgi:4'-phosphopantetheinyl transferase EntD
VLHGFSAAVPGFLALSDPGRWGSITHCAGYGAFAVARDRDIATIGLDAERAMLAALTAAWPQVCWDRMLFSAREPVYEAWFPVTRR